MSRPQGLSVGSVVAAAPQANQILVTFFSQRITAQLPGAQRAHPATKVHAVQTWHSGCFPGSEGDQTSDSSFPAVLDRGSQNLAPSGDALPFGGCSRVGSKRVAYWHFSYFPPPNRACGFQRTRLTSVSFQLSFWMTSSTVSAVCITHTSLSFGLTHLPPFAV